MLCGLIPLKSPASWTAASSAHQRLLRKTIRIQGLNSFQLGGCLITARKRLCVALQLHFRPPRTRPSKLPALHLTGSHDRGGCAGTLGTPVWWSENHWKNDRWWDALLPTTGVSGQTIYGQLSETDNPPSTDQASGVIWYHLQVKPTNRAWLVAGSPNKRARHHSVTLCHCALGTNTRRAPQEVPWLGQCYNWKLG